MPEGHLVSFTQCTATSQQRPACSASACQAACPTACRHTVLTGTVLVDVNRQVGGASWLDAALLEEQRVGVAQRAQGTVVGV